MPVKSEFFGICAECISYDNCPHRTLLESLTRVLSGTIKRQTDTQSTIYVNLDVEVADCSLFKLEEVIHEQNKSR